MKKIIGIFLCMMLLFTIFTVSISSLTNFNDVITVDDDGSADYTKIQDAIDNASNGDTVYVYSGIYYENVIVDKSIDLIGEDKNSTYIINESIGSIINIISDNVNVSNFTIMDNDSQQTYGIYINANFVDIFQNNIHSDICNIRLSGNYTKIIQNNLYYSHYGIKMNNYPINDTDTSNNNIIKNNFFINTIYSGIYLFNSTNNLIKNNFFNNSEIYLYTCSNNTLENNNLTSADIRLAEPYKHTLSNNTILRGGLTLEFGGPYSNLVEFHNSLRKFIYNDIEITNMVNGKPIRFYVNKTNITVQYNSGQVFLINCTNITISNLEINNTSYAIEAIESKNIIIKENTLTKNYNDLLIVFVNNSEISNNTIHNNTMGCNMYCCNNISILNNSIINNTNAIDIYLSENNIIKKNNIYDSDFSGIEIIGSSNNTIKENNVTNNDYGLQIIKENWLNITSSDNSIYHNNFINNSINSYDECTNKWYNITIEEGNYWSDYQGNDEDENGIGDTPYNIPGGNNKDLYPLGIFNKQPFADFDYLPLDPQSNVPVQFTDISYDLDGTIVSWDWDFGDGYSSSLQNPNHTYASSGIYSITLEVTDNDGSSTVVSKLALVDHGLFSITNMSLNWNFISNPYNFWLSKGELLFRFGSYYYNWTQITTNINPTRLPIISPFIYGWDRLNQTYIFSDFLEPGYGYWLYAYQYCDIYIPEFDNYYDGYITDLEENWNIIGLTYNQTINKSQIIIQHNDTNYTWNEAVTGGITSDFIFGWDRITQSYTFSDNISPGYAYWLYSNENCSMYILIDNFTLKAKYYYFRSYRNGGGIFPVYIIPSFDFTGNVTLSINADADLNASLNKNKLNRTSPVAEITIRPNNNTNITTHVIELTATHGNISKTIFLEVEMINVIIGDPDMYLLGKRDEFISWLESEHPEIGNLSNQNWFAYRTYPQILVVVHWTFLSSEWELRICCHITIPPHNWSKLCLRRLGEIEPIIALHREGDGTTYEIPIEDYPIKYGY